MAYEETCYSRDGGRRLCGTAEIVSTSPGAGRHLPCLIRHRLVSLEIEAAPPNSQLLFPAADINHSYLKYVARNKLTEGAAFMANCLDWSQCPAVESIPGKVSGAWVLRGTRMPVKTLFENLEAGMSIEEVMEQSPAIRSTASWPSSRGRSTKPRRSASRCGFFSTTAHHGVLPSFSPGTVWRKRGCG
jgi:uncharacterized protein (DUF433 family)